MTKSAYHYGFRSQENEITQDELPVQGTIPDWLTGSLIRTAPSKFEVGQEHYRHWFDGLAMLHKFSFADQRVSYRCRFLNSEAYQQARRKNQIVYGEYGTDPCRDLFQKVVSVFRGPRATDNGCVNINPYGWGLTATTETPKPVMFRLDTLETEGTFPFEDEVAGQVTIVHPHYDREGTMFSYLTNFGYKSTYNVYAQAPGSRTRKLIASVPTDEPAYMHSIGMTENYVILTEFPIVTNPLKFRFSQKPFIENYRWKPERGTKIHVVEKTGAVQSFEVEPFFAFHHANAFEQDGEIIFDIVAHRDADVINQLYLHHLRSEQPSSTTGQLWRFRIQPTLKAVSQQVIASVPIELPRINYARVNAQDYQYVYGAGTTVPDNFLDNITKVDVTSGQETIWHQEHCYPGEPVFVETPDAQTEDDGILLSIVLDARQQTSFLLVLNAENLQEIARASVPQHITFGFHGQYVPSEDPSQVMKTMHR